MPVPTITQPQSPRIIPVNTAFSLQLSASESPTGWAMASGPTGLTISSGGLISGTPTAANTVAAASITATNGAGTSAAITLIFVIANSVPGLAPNAFARALDWDLGDDKLSLPGIAGPEPASGAPGSGEDTPLLTLKTGATHSLSVGLISAGVLQEPGLDYLSAWLRTDDPDAGAVELSLDSSDITVTGANETARHEIKITVPADGTVATWIEDGTLSDGNRTGFNGRLELIAQVINDARDFTGNDTEAVGNLTAGQTVNDTLFVALDDEFASAPYNLTIAFLSPSDTALAHSFAAISATVTWTGSAFAISGTLPAAEANDATGADDWGVTLSVQSLSGNATGISAAVRVVADAAPTLWSIPIVNPPSGTLVVNGNGTVTPSPDPCTVGLFEGATEIFDFVINDGDDADDILAALTAAAVGTDYEGLVESVELDDATSTIRLFFDPSASDLDGYDWSDSAVTTSADSESPAQITLSDCSWTLAVAGFADPSAEETRISQSAPVQVIKKLGTPV
jgi:hypothetical protein